MNLWVKSIWEAGENKEIWNTKEEPGGNHSIENCINSTLSATHRDKFRYKNPKLSRLVYWFIKS